MSLSIPGTFRRFISPPLMLMIALCLTGAVLNFASTAMAGDTLTAGSTYYQPQRGTAERRAIMDAARVPVSADLGQSVIFVVDVLRTDGAMAYLQATPLNPDGTPFDWLNSPYKEDWQADMMSDVIMVLLERAEVGWSVRDHIIGPTDVAWYEWVDRYSLPERLFFGG